MIRQRARTASKAAESPLKIVSLLSSATETLFAIGLANSVVAVSHECDWPVQATTLPRATFSHLDSSQPSDAIDRQVRERLATGLPLYGIDAELLALLQPDLIITQVQCDVCAIRYQDVLNLVHSEPKLAQARILALGPTTLAEILGDVLRIGEAAGAREAAANFHRRLVSRVAAVSEKTEIIPQAARPSVVCIEWTSPIMTAGNWTPRLIELAGGVGALAGPGQHSRYVDWEQIVALDPDVLLIAPCGFGLARSLQEAEMLTALPGWRKLNAVRNRRVFVLDGNALLNRSGPRIVDSLEVLSHLISPGLFSPPRFPFESWLRLAE